jgi:MFS transporter, DHA1 family, solute carrier family 18 (vesicular amine transporter), member 1/2
MSIASSRTTVLGVVTFATFLDIVAYSMAVPVLPDLGRKLGASPTMIGLLFGSFGVTLLATSIPMGAVSDRIGRKGPLVGGLVALAAATVLFAFADGLPGLFVARLVQGAADAVTWVVGFALIADLYEPSERGRASGIVMSGTSVALMVGPSLGGWLYEVGGPVFPFLVVAGMAAAGGVAMLGLKLPARHADVAPASALAVIQAPAVAACAAAVVTVAATISMVEPVLSLHLSTRGVNPGRIGLVFAIAAVAAPILHPIYGSLADRWGARRLTLGGLMISGALLPMLGLASDFRSAAALFVVVASGVALVITPSLAYMADATASVGVSSFGVAYGVYNVAWGIGLLGGPALGGFLFERIGLAPLTLCWAPVVVLIGIVLSRVHSPAEAGLPASLSVMADSPEP